MGTGNLTISDSYLKDFANKNLASFITALTPTAIDTANPSIPALTEFADGLPSGGTPGGDPSGGYNQVLPGNAAALNSAAALQANFTKYAAALSTQFQNLAAAAHTLSGNLLAVDSVLDNSDDAANITAAEMTTDVSDVSFGGSGTGPGNPGPPPPNPGGNTK